MLDTDTIPRTLVDCSAGNYEDATFSLCVACPTGKTSTAGATSAAQCYCPAGSYLYTASSLCVPCPGVLTSSAGATSVEECYCVAGVFTNCALNALLVEHAPHSVYAGEAWDGSGTLPDLSGNGRDAVLMVAPSPGSQGESQTVRCQVRAISAAVPHGFQTRVAREHVQGPKTIKHR